MNDNTLPTDANIVVEVKNNATKTLLKHAAIKIVVAVAVHFATDAIIKAVENRHSTDTTTL